MGARNELNTFHIMGSLGVAGISGLATGSVAVFVIAGAALIGAGSTRARDLPRLRKHETNLNKFQIVGSLRVAGFSGSDLRALPTRMCGIDRAVATMRPGPTPANSI